MKSALKYSGLWDVVEQGVELLPEDLPLQRTVQQTLADGTVQNQIIPGPTNAEVLAYDAAVKAWKDLNNQATELIYSMCEEKPAEAIEDIEHATNRWVQLETDYTDSGFVLRYTKLQELWTTTLISSGNSIETYIANIRTKSKDLKRMGAPIDSWILVALLLNNLDSKYKDFVHRQVVSLDEMPDFDKIVTLLHEEDRLLKKDNKEQAMAAAMKRFHKEQEDKKASKGGTSNRNSNTNSSGRGKTGRNGSNSGGNPSTNKNSSNYKGDGDPPECTKCTPLANGNRKKHWPFDCWTLHEDKKPERFRNTESKPKAGTAGTATKDRPDDFVDNNGTHISAMGHLICSAIDVGNDDEDWGFAFNAATPNFGGEVLTEFQEDERSPEPSPIEDSSCSGNGENDLCTPHGALIASPYLNGEACGGVESISASPPNSPYIILHLALSANTELSSNKSPDWMIDSGCTNHMYFDKDEFTQYQLYRAGILLANDVTI